MVQAFTTTELLADIRDQARIPADEGEASDVILLREATRVLHSIYVPAVRKARADYYVITADIPLLAGVATYSIPRRATTGSVRSVRVRRANNEEYGLAQVTLEDVPTGRTGTRPTHFAINDDCIQLHPVPNNTTYQLRVTFEYRPSQLVVPTVGTNCAQVSTSTFNTTTDLFTLYATAGVFTTASVVDVVRADPPFSSPLIDATLLEVAQVGGFDGLQLVSWTGSQSLPTATISAASPGAFGIKTGDYICSAGETVIPQIPAELHPLLALHTAARWLRPIDLETAAVLNAVADADLERMLHVLSPRKQGVQQKIKPRHSTLRVRRGYGPNSFGDLS